MRWEEQRGPERPAPPRRWGVAAAITGLGVVLTAVVLSSGSPTPAPRHAVVATAPVEEPTARGGLPHTDPAPPPPSPAAVSAPPVVEAAVTTPARTTSRAPAAPVVARAGQPCDVAGATAVAADGAPLVCRSDNGNGHGSPRWRKA